MNLSINEKFNSIVIDLSEYDSEVVSYVFDQLPDRLNEIEQSETLVSIESDSDKKTVSFTSPIIALIDRILDEKIADIDYERRHGERE